MQLRLQLRLAEVHGRERITADLRQLAIDLVGRAEPGELGREHRALLDRAVSRATAQVDPSLIDRFLAGLAESLEDVPDELWRRLSQIQMRRGIGEE